MISRARPHPYGQDGSQRFKVYGELPSQRRIFIGGVDSMDEVWAIACSGRDSYEAILLADALTPAASARVLLVGGERPSIDAISSDGKSIGNYDVSTALALGWTLVEDKFGLVSHALCFPLPGPAMGFRIYSFFGACRADANLAHRCLESFAGSDAPPFTGPPDLSADECRLAALWALATIQRQQIELELLEPASARRRDQESAG